MTVEIRVLGPGDVSVLDEVAEDVFDDPLIARSTEAYLDDPRHHLVVAVEEGVVIGFVSAFHYLHPDKEHPELWINEVGVAPASQRRGVGKALLRATFDLGRRLGCPEAWVATERVNAPAVKLYAAVGGVEDPQTAVVYTFTLAPGSSGT